MFPGSLLPHNYAEAENPERLLARSEVERRRDYIQTLCRQLGEQHPLVQVVHQCLHNIPSRRPSTEELLPRLEDMRSEIEGPYGSHLKKVDVVKVGMLKALTEIGEQMQQLEVGWLCVRLQIRDTDLVQDMTESTRFFVVVQLEQARETEAKDVQLKEKDTEIERQHRELQALRVRNSQSLQLDDVL